MDVQRVAVAAGHRRGLVAVEAPDRQAHLLVAQDPRGELLVQPPHLEPRGPQVGHLVRHLATSLAVDGSCPDEH
ncbi:hypothetical protein ACQPX6_19550 [Actinomycetospora sp. CA-101289]|uniref:hypothetical protein n=1 Tax=Actinomycetospora sp. CA-101289 TaxID=3239893 RepID=UPI003D99315F